MKANNNWYKLIRHNRFLTKMLWTLLFICIYLLGRSLPVPLVSLNQAEFRHSESQQLLDQLATVTGGDLSNLTLFSIGLSPWMSAMILWRFVTVFKLLKGLTAKQSYRAQLYLALAISFIHSYGATVSADFSSSSAFGFNNPILMRSITILLLMTGSFILVWLGNANTRLGIGGMMIIVLTNMILTLTSNGLAYFVEHTRHQHLVIQLLIFAIVLSILIMLAVISYRAEYRIPIRRVAINTSYPKKSYLPIRLMPAGSMPFMYGMTLMMLPLYVLNILSEILPDNQILIYMSENIGLTQPLGAIFYILLLYILSLGFAYYNYDPYDMAKSMRQNGEYITSVKPGSETQSYLASKVFLLVQIGAIYIILIGGLPLLLLVGQSEGVSLALLINNAFIVSTLMLGLIEQINSLRMWRQYQNLL